MPELSIPAIFVYGTLKRGQCREQMWPIPAVKVTEAWVFGMLYGRADYPALRQGDDRVGGELWLFSEQSIKTVIQRLDQIECSNQKDIPDLYTRETIEAFDQNGNSLGLCYCYFYAEDPSLDGFERLTPSTIQPESIVHWPEK